METKEKLVGLKKGLSSLQARVLALLILMFFVFPTVSQASTEEPRVTVQITSANSTIRGDALELEASVTGNFQTVSFRWSFPKGFRIVNGTLENTCKGDCRRSVRVQVLENATLGPQDVGVELEYE